MYTKVCKVCKLTLPVEDFAFYSVNGVNKDYRRPRCKPCQANYQRDLLARQRATFPKKDYQRCLGCKLRLHKHEFARNPRNHTRLDAYCHICKEANKVVAVVIEVDRQIQARKKKPP
jgi:hypothetical protein